MSAAPAMAEVSTRAASNLLAKLRKLSLRSDA